MTDNKTMILIGAYRDGELSPSETFDLERRLAADPESRVLSDRLGTLSGALHETLAMPPAPAALHTKLSRQFGTATPLSRRFGLQAWQALAAALVVGLVGGGLIGAGGTYLQMQPGTGATMEAVAAGHLRGLAAPQPFDIASSNRHVVKPWFNGRTTIAPEAPDLADKGFPLVGGRIDVIDGKSVPTLVYQHDKHVISVTIVPRTTSAASGENRLDGSTIEHWNAGDLTYWAVSDVAGKDLRAFVDLYRAQTAQ